MGRSYLILLWNRNWQDVNISLHVALTWQGRWIPVIKYTNWRLHKQLPEGFLWKYYHLHIQGAYKFQLKGQGFSQEEGKGIPQEVKVVKNRLNKLYGWKMIRVSISKHLGWDPTIFSAGRYGECTKMEFIMW